MKLTKQILFLFSIILISPVVFSQITISGKVCIDFLGNECPGVIVTELNSSNETITNNDGEFSLYVADSSMIQFTYVKEYDTIGQTFYSDHYHTIIPANKLNNETIVLKPYITYEMLITQGRYERFSIGYYGDINYLNYGLFLSISQPDFLKLRENFYYKTNFNSDYNFEISLIKTFLNKYDTYIFNLGAGYHKRKMNFLQLNYKINDVYIFFRNRISNLFYLEPGLIYREEIVSEIENNIGYYLSINKKFNKIGSDITCRFSIINGYSEYRLAIYPDLPFNNRVLKHYIKLGLIYDRYRKYDELSIVLRYRFIY